MQLFYDPDLSPGHHQLRASDARHAAQVLRKRTGDVLDLVDGRGGWYRGTIRAIDKRSCGLEVTLHRREAQRAGHRTTLFFAPTKSAERVEWLVEKATEIGVDHLQPMVTRHTERKKLRVDRLERIAETAMKQCLRAWLPTIGPLIPFAEALQLTPAGDTRLFPYLGETKTPLIRDTYERGNNVSIAIGPEGGFSPEEAATARSAGYTFVSLGPNRLRMETAGMAALHTVESLNW